MLSCKEATQLASQGMERPLSLGERIHLRVHLVLCIGCRRAERQFRLLRGLLGAWRPGRD